MYARLRIKATFAAAVERVGAKMSKKFNIEYTKFFQADLHRNLGHKPRAQASSLSLRAPGSGNQGTSVQAGPGHKLQGQKYFFCV